MADNFGTGVRDDHLVLLGHHVNPLADQRLRHQVASRAEPNAAAFFNLALFAGSQRWPLRRQGTQDLPLTHQSSAGMAAISLWTCWLTSVHQLRAAALAAARSGQSCSSSAGTIRSVWTYPQRFSTRPFDSGSYPSQKSLRKPNRAAYATYSGCGTPRWPPRQPSGSPSDR